MLTDYKPKLLGLVRHKVGVKHDTIRTAHASTDWIERFILFNRTRRSVSMGAPELLALDLTIPPSRLFQADEVIQ